MTNFVTRWRAPMKKPPPRKYLNSAGSPLVLCSFRASRQWLLQFADGSTRVTDIRPTAQMVSIHNATVSKAARKASSAAMSQIREAPSNWD